MIAELLIATNVLFIAVDDMRVEPRAVTPNLDALAAESRVYTNAYTTALWCLPARNAVMYGVSPPPANTDPLVSLPEILSQAGYTTAVTGKIFHHNAPQPQRWDVNGPKMDMVELFYATVLLDDMSKMPSGELPAGVIDQDQGFADWAIDFMATTTGPWFLGVGFFQPHLPWMPEAEDYALYPSVTPYAYTNDLNDESGPAKQLANEPYFDGIAQYDLVEAAGTAETKTRDYLAAISHTDRMIGQVLDAAPPGTTVILWADHGFHLGEKRHWRKKTYWDQTVRVPLMIRSTSFETGTVSNPVSTLDIAPTVLDLLNLPPHPQHEGVSLITGASPVKIYHENGMATVENGVKTVVYDVNQPAVRSTYDLVADPEESTNLTPPGC
jgi:arylsulfatase A-like enzyme